jgi:hypothetical protein
MRHLRLASSRIGGTPIAVTYCLKQRQYVSPASNNCPHWCEMTTVLVTVGELQM